MTELADQILRLATPGVQSLAPYPPGKPIDELEREYGIQNIIKLASNENPLGPSPLALAAAQKTFCDIHRYPDGNGFALKQRLAQKHHVDMAQITLGNGSNDILEFAARAFITPQNEVIFSEHAFAIYAIVTRAVGAKAVVTPAKNWGHDLEAMRQAITPHTRLILITNPNNPTGTWLRAAELEKLIQQVPRHVLVVVDEAYFEYVLEAEYPNTIPWVARYPNLIVTRTFSKAYGLAGLRVGYGISSVPVAGILNRVRQPFNVNSAALAAATAALDDEAHVARVVELNRAGMRQLVEGFTELGLKFIPSAGNFICVDLGFPATPIYQRLLREGVIVRPVANYAMPNHLRITVGLPQENQRFLEALRKILKQ